MLVVLFVLAGVAGGGTKEEKDAATSAITTAPPADVTETTATPAPSETTVAAKPKPKPTTTTEAPKPALACKDAKPSQKVDTQKQGLYPDRPDIKNEDHEAAVGDCVRLSGYTAYVKGSAVETSEFSDPEIVVTVTVQNRDDSAQAFNTFDWSILTPAGTVIDPTIYFGDGGLDSGDLVKGGEASGKIAFDGADKGTYYVIYKPDPFDGVRGVWQITV